MTRRRPLTQTVGEIRLLTSAATVPLVVVTQSSSLRPSRPGGTPAEISRGQVRASGRSPRIPSSNARLPRRGIEENAGSFPPECEAAAPCETHFRARAWGWVRLPPRLGAGDFFDAPLGHRSLSRLNRGPWPLARPCPRLISCGVPPGRDPNRPGSFSAFFPISAVLCRVLAPSEAFLKTPQRWEGHRERWPAGGPRAQRLRTPEPPQCFSHASPRADVLRPGTGRASGPPTIARAALDPSAPRTFLFPRFAYEWPRCG